MSKFGDKRAREHSCFCWYSLKKQGRNGVSELSTRMVCRMKIGPSQL
jgi:hypothetical protein